MSKRDQTKLFLPSASPEELAITALDNDTNIYDATFTCENTQNNEVLIRYYSHRTYQILSIIDRHFA